MEPGSRWPRRLLIGAGLIVLSVFATTWLASSSRSAYAFEAVDTVLIVNDGGAVRVRTLASVDPSLTADLAAQTGGDLAIDPAGVVVRTTDSWLLGKPGFESLQRDGELVIRATCSARLPCRTTLDVYVPQGIELTVVAASDMVEVDSFDGALLVFAGDEGVVLGSVTGSVSVVSDGPVRGSTLGPAELTIEVGDGPVQLTYLDLPDVLAITGVSSPVTVELLSSADYAMDIEAAEVLVSVDENELSERRVSIRTDGRVVVEPTLTE